MFHHAPRGASAAIMLSIVMLCAGNQSATAQEPPKPTAQQPRPQDPVPPLPYRAEEVVVVSPADGVRLAGTLTIPAGEGPFPALFLASGSGHNDRDYGNNPWNHRTFLVLADMLTRQGVAVLRLDDRGIGGSGGSYREATNDITVSDALAAVAFLAARTEVDASRAGILGHSWGGTVALLAAARSDAVKQLVLLGSGGGRPFSEEMAAQRAAVVRSYGGTPEQQAHTREWFLALQAAALSEPDSAAAVARVQEVMEEYRRLEATQSDEPPIPDEVWQQILQQQARVLVNRWYLEQLRTDPADYLPRVRVPVLALTGSLDTSAPPEELAVLEAGLRQAGNPDVTVEELPGINHLLQTAPDANTELAEIEETVAPIIVERIMRWLRAR